MGDIFFEQIVKKKSSVKDNIIKAVVLLAALLLAVLIFPLVFSQFFGAFAFLLAIGFLVLGWYIISGLNLEYEYIFTNGEIDIDKISAKRKRKRMLTVKVSSFDEFEKYDAEKIRAKKHDKTFNACTSVFDEDTRCATFRGKEGQACLLIFSPNEKLAAEIEKTMRLRNLRR